MLKIFLLKWNCVFRVVISINGNLHKNFMLFSEKSRAVPDIPLFVSLFSATVQRISAHSFRKFLCLRVWELSLISVWQHRRFQDDGEFEEIVYKRDTPLIWRSLKEYNLTETETCRNSEQGVKLITDERGFICAREDLLATGCCNFKADGTHLYQCETCNENHCCEIYENCVSCCLNPDNVCLI